MGCPSSVPRFQLFGSSSPRASRTLARVGRKDTRCERLLRTALKNLELKATYNVTDLPGKPDFVLSEHGIIVFCDGDFWHGRNWRERRAKLAKGANAAYWTKKIESNIRRDRRICRHLRELGWTVLRCWEGDILKNPTRVAARIHRHAQHLRFAPPK